MNYLPEFKKLVKTDFDEWKQKGFCARARKLNESIGEVEKYFDEAEPQYFTGNPDAELVLVHLNPKRNRNLFSKVNSFEDFQAYWNTIHILEKINTERIPIELTNHRLTKNRYDFSTHSVFYRSFQLTTKRVNITIWKSSKI